MHIFLSLWNTPIVITYYWLQHLTALEEEVLSRWISKLVDNNQINLIKGSRNCFVPSHSLYVDDIMIFCRRDKKFIKAIAKLLNDYAFGMVDFVTRLSLLFMQVAWLTTYTNYWLICLASLWIPFLSYTLGPIFSLEDLRLCTFQFIADRIRIKLVAWKAILFSIAGRVQLVKSVIQSMLVHCISIHNWPASIIKIMKTWIRNFIWSGNLDKKKILTVSWKACCKSIKQGGVG